VKDGTNRPCLIQNPMFLIRRPSQQEIAKFLNQSRDLALSYEPVGIARQTPLGFNTDLASAVIGHGRETFERAKIALGEWRHYEMGWVELFPRGAAIEPGTVVAVLVHHLGFWSLNACRVVYRVGDRHTGSSFGFAYGTLTNHAELGEEIFEVMLEPETDDVVFSIQAVSKPHAALARIGYPVARYYQGRFRRDSTSALRRAILEIAGAK
jgi:uncharacterized protein (UPF0548 family)